jgi:hypothetical protein
MLDRHGRIHVHRPQQCNQQRRRRHHHQATREACSDSLRSCRSVRRRRPHGPATNPAYGTDQDPHPRPNSHIHMAPATSHRSTGTRSNRSRPAQQRHGSATSLVPSPATEESTGIGTAKPTDQYEGAVRQKLLLTTEQPTRRHARPPINGTPSKEPTSCSAHTITASWIATSVAAVNPRRSLHTSLTPQDRRRLSGPSAPSSHSHDT